jgi:hypothetical protein
VWAVADFGNVHEKLLLLLLILIIIVIIIIILLTLSLLFCIGVELGRSH